ncbi:unnamed protein product [Hydatigera taeniaeformis]|uniref:Uncharacterized protein n=1 Tax=Hydatigena taeniaeformis TaxID=6205 RepID=A0A0R3X8V2_HYDTA|nr:unnamed protein product [Hydatigera taeniaeformis]
MNAGRIGVADGCPVAAAAAAAATCLRPSCQFFVSWKNVWKEPCRGSTLRYRLMIDRERVLQFILRLSVRFTAFINKALFLLLLLLLLLLSFLPSAPIFFQSSSCWHGGGGGGGGGGDDGHLSTGLPTRESDRAKEEEEEEEEKNIITMEKNAARWMDFCDVVGQGLWIHKLKAWRIGGTSGINAWVLMVKVSVGLQPWYSSAAAVSSSSQRRVVETTMGLLLVWSCVALVLVRCDLALSIWTAPVPLGGVSSAVVGC